MLTRRAALAGLLVTAGCGPVTLLTAADPSIGPVPVGATRLIALRHADRDPSAVELNAVGVERAAALPGALEPFDIDAILTRDTKRNIDSAAPLAAATGIEPQVLGIAIDDGAVLADILLTASPGGTVVWIGNSGNLVPLWEALGASGAAPVVYGEIAVLDIVDGDIIALNRFTFGPT